MGECHNPQLWQKEFDTPFLLSLYMHVQRMECTLVHLQVGSTRLSVTYEWFRPQ